jgi:hypothetical protein
LASIAEQPGLPVVRFIGRERRWRGSRAEVVWATPDNDGMSERRAGSIGKPDVACYRLLGEHHGDHWGAVQDLEERRVPTFV